MDNPYDWDTHCIGQAHSHIRNLEEKLEKCAALVEAVRDIANDCFDADGDMLIHHEKARPSSIAKVVACFLEHHSEALTTEAPAEQEQDIARQTGPNEYEAHLAGKARRFRLLTKEDAQAIGAAIYALYKTKAGDRPMFPEQSEVCQKCKTKAVVIMDGIETCLKCGYSVQPADDREGE